jgi:hypothetical protein
MTVRKSDIRLRGDRTPAYVDRETGAAELLISPDTWDNWVREGILPPSCATFPNGSPRWRWEDVDRKLSGKAKAANDNVEATEPGVDLMMKGALSFGSEKGNRRRRTA